jgi:hypothetical protein
VKALKQARVVRLAALASLVTAACGTGGPARDPHARANTAGPFVAAMHEEQVGDPGQARAHYLDVLSRAEQAPDDPVSLYTAAAALDALVSRTVSSFATATDDSGLVYRTVDGSLGKPEAKPADHSTLAELARIADDADDPFTRGLIARAMEEMYTHRGDTAEARSWRVAHGCATEARVTGPLDWAGPIAVREDDPLAAFGAQAPAATPLPGKLKTMLDTAVVARRGCSIPLVAVSARSGVRDVLVDVEVPDEGDIGIALRSHSPTTLRANGLLLVDRGAELGGDEVARFVRAHADRGTVRLVVRTDMQNDGEGVEIDVFDAHGKPLRTHAPAVGSRADARLGHPVLLAMPAAGNDDERALLAAGALALGEPRTAERMLSPYALRSDASPAVALLYGRAVDSAEDLSAVERAERARSVHERVIEAWPGAWESIAAHARLAGERRGEGEAEIETLRDLDQQRAKASASLTRSTSQAALLDAFDATVSGEAHLFDRAAAAFDRAKGPLAGTSLLVDVEDAAFQRVGAESIAFDCSTAAPHKRDDLDCHDDLRAKGDLLAAEAEIERVRQLVGARDAWLGISLRDAFGAHDLPRVKSIVSRLLPGERTLSDEMATGSPGSPGGSDASGDIDRGRLSVTPLTARDAPQALGPLFVARGDDALRPFDGEAEKLAAADRAAPILPSAATAILRHEERYDVGPHGVVRFTLFDVRRVSGTTDVEENAQAPLPQIGGRESSRVLRRRIFKKDGRVLEPDPTPHASQGHADLAQLEQGDIVEAVYDGFSIPGESGSVAIDTPDLLPERTGVHEAKIVMHLPDALQPTLWSHPMLGTAQTTHDGGGTTMTWTLHDHPIRRQEEGTPRMDRPVGVSFTTTTWKDVGRAFRAQLAGLVAPDPEVTLWAQQAVREAKATTDRTRVDALVEASGRAVREASAGMLTDIDVDETGTSEVSARSALTTHAGSRTWLVVTAARELGMRAEVVLAETEPFSASADFPPHFGRFGHALAEVFPRDDAKSKGPIWLDLDVPGPPLPAGHISPELRGRSCLYEDGTITEVPDLGNDGVGGDVVDLRLVIDEKGDAKGQLTALLHGRESQELAEALVRLVGDQRQRALRNVVLAWLPSASVDEVLLSSDEGAWQVALRASLTIGGYAQSEGKGAKKMWILPGLDPIHVVYPRAVVSTLGASFASQATRESALAINRALQFHLHRRVELPEGAQVVRPAAPFDIHRKPITASRVVTVEGTAVDEQFALDLTTGTVAAQHYGDFVGDAHKTDDAFLAGTRVKPAAE